MYLKKTTLFRLGTSTPVLNNSTVVAMKCEFEEPLNSTVGYS